MKPQKKYIRNISLKQNNFFKPDLADWYLINVYYLHFGNKVSDLNKDAINLQIPLLCICSFLLRPSWKYLSLCAIIY